MKKFDQKLLACSVLTLFLTGCKAKETAVPPSAKPAEGPAVTATVLEVDEFGDAILDIKKSDLTYSYGDSLKLDFSSGYSPDNVAFFPYFYGGTGQVVIVTIGDTISVAGIDHNFCREHDVAAGDTVAIRLDQAGEFSELLKAYDLPSPSVQREDQTAEQFRNARPVVAGTITEGILYRGGTPFKENYTRSDLMADYIQEKGIQTIVSLSEASAENLTDINLHENIRSMINNGQVIFIPFGAAYDDPENMVQLGIGLREMMHRESPYLIQCTLGKDQSGIIVAMLESLCGASPQEVMYDYMLSFENLHGLELDPQSRPYQLYRDQFLERLGQMGFPVSTFSDENLEPHARSYLKNCGLSEEEIDALRAILEGKDVVLPEIEPSAEPTPES